jgi:hypothetical protein
MTLKSEPTEIAGQVSGFPPSNILGNIMNTQIENRQLSRSARAAHKKKQEYESLQAQYRELEARNRALAMHVEAFNTLQHSEVTNAVVFSSVDKAGSSWINLSADLKAEVEDTMKHPEQTIIHRREAMEFLPKDVDIQVTVRAGVAPEIVLKNLQQIFQTIQRGKWILMFRAKGPSYVVFNTKDIDDYHSYFMSEVYKTDV